jgi:hypothetical protein
VRGEGRRGEERRGEERRGEERERRSKDQEEGVGVGAETQDLLLIF